MSYILSCVGALNIVSFVCCTKYFVPLHNLYVQIFLNVENRIVNDTFRTVN